VKTPKFKTKKGDLTHYAFACGYLQIFDCGQLRLTLWHEGGSVFHVRLFDHENKTRIFWHSFERMLDARKYWHQTKNNLLELSKLKT